MTRLRIVKPDGEAGDLTMSEAITALATRCISDQPVAALMAWEKDGKLIFMSVPDSACLKLGVVDMLYDAVHPELTEE